jgi:DNA repair protein RadC
MQDHETLSIRRDDPDDAQPNDAARSANSRLALLPLRTAADPTTRLVAEVTGTTAQRAAELLDTLGGLEALAFASESDLVAASLSRGRARLVHAAFQLARQSIGARPQIGQRLAGASEVWTHMRARLSGAPVEEFWAIALDVRHRVVFDSMLARGSLTGVEIHPRDVFRPLVRRGVAAVLFCHNHPSGDPAPSRADIELTIRLREVGDLCGIPVLDHVIVGAQGFVSLAERNWQ